MKPAVNKKTLRNVVLIVVLLFVTGYVLHATGVTERALNYWETRFGDSGPDQGTQPPPDDTDPVAPEPVPEPEPEPVPEPKPEPVPEPEPEPEPTPVPKPTPVPEPKPDPEPAPEPPPANPGGNEPDTPVIFVNQQLIIPTSSSAEPTGSSKVVKEGLKSGGQKQIALTFDAGWLYDQTIPLLDVLDQYKVKSTFFPRALWVKAHPDLAREIVTRGHIIENHSLTHGDLSKMTDADVRKELRESTKIIKETVNGSPYLFRPPYGAYNSRMLKILAEEGYPYTVMWTVDTHDWAEEIRGQKVTTDYLVRRVLDNASDNGIILMHIGGFNTVEALPRIITGLREKGYKLVTVNEMIPRPAAGQVTHTVRQGDTLFSISRQYGVTVEEIILVNGLR